MEKEKTDVVPYTTVEQYREYMSGSPDDDKTQRHNPPPKDGITLAELGRKRDNEILSIINEMGQCENKSDIRVMYCHGYSFSWNDLTVIADFKGFINDTPGQRKAHYSMPDNSAGEKKVNTSTDRIEFYRGLEAYPIEKKLYLSKEASSMLKSIFIRESSGKPYENSIKSRILSAITEKAIAETYRKKKEGTLKIIAKEEEI